MSIAIKAATTNAVITSTVRTRRETLPGGTTTTRGALAGM